MRAQQTSKQKKKKNRGRENETTTGVLTQWRTVAGTGTAPAMAVGGAAAAHYVVPAPSDLLIHSLQLKVAGNTCVTHAPDEWLGDEMKSVAF